MTNCITPVSDLSGRILLPLTADLQARIDGHLASSNELSADHRANRENEA